MQKLLTTYGSDSQLFMFIVAFIISWNLENIAGVVLTYNKWKHAMINFPFSFTNLPGQLLLGFAFVKLIHWEGVHNFGFLYHLPFKINSLILFSLSFLFLDFGEYIYHLIMHKVKRLWMFHLVHHSDEIVDVSTTFREHPGENIIRLCFTLIWVFLSGTVFWMLMLRQLIQTITTLFAHMNYRLPERLDNWLGYVFITPNLHQVHHHFEQPYTDCNYGDVLSIWDHMFGTLKKLPANKLIFGIDTYMNEPQANNFFGLAALPFGKYRKRENKNIVFNLPLDNDLK